MRTSIMFTGAATLAALIGAPCVGQTFGLDDNPRAPASGYPGFGFGAENPFGYIVPGFPPGLAPSPSLLMIPCQDADMLSAGPAMNIASPNGPYLDCVSMLTRDYGQEVRIVFSVDRLSPGLPGSAVAMQAGLNQQPGDVFRTIRRFKSPSLFVGTPGAAPYGGVLLGSVVPGPDSNTLLHDESVFGLLAGGAVVSPTAQAAPIMPGSHDNLEQYETFSLNANGDSFFDQWTYFSIYPDEAVAVGQFPNEIWDVPPGSTGTVSSAPWAISPQMGLDPVGDSIDALVVYDNGQIGGIAHGGPGAETGIDYALFSLAPGSVSLAQFQLTAADIFFTDFSGKFFTYAPGMTLGVVAEDGGVINAGANVDALEVTCVTDLDSDGDIDFQDLLILLASWGPNPGSPADFNGNGQVDFNDLVLLLSVWGPCS